MKFETFEEVKKYIDVNNIVKIVIINPFLSKNEIIKVKIEKAINFFYISKFTKTQVFHDKIEDKEILEFITTNYINSYKQVNIWLYDNKILNILISKRGKIHMSISNEKNKNSKIITEHNRNKNYIIKDGVKIPALIDIGVMDNNGNVNKTRYDKFKQINKFIEIIDDVFKNKSDLFSDKEFNIIDFGCGKAYLTFILYYYFTELLKVPVKITGLDLKEDVVNQCNETAKKYGYHNLKFKIGDIKKFKPDKEVDMVISLHACDTATDYAIYNAIRWGAKMIFSVPCCQHEVNKEIKAETLSIFTRYGIMKERFSSILTDIIRANILEIYDYKTQILEFIDMDHTPKNIMIRAVKKKNMYKESKKKNKCIYEIEKAIKEFAVEPTLYKLLVKNKKLQN